MIFFCEDFVFLRCTSVLWSCYVVGKNRKLSNWSLSSHLALLLNNLQASLRISGSLFLLGMNKNESTGSKIKENSSRLLFFFAIKS